MRLTFVYLRLFDATAEDMLSDADMQRAEQALLDNPWRGDVESGTGGVRKLRVAVHGRGKRGGARVMYLYVERTAHVFFILAYLKNAQGTLSEREKKQVRALVTMLSLEG